MNGPGEVGRAATGFIDALKSQPLSLALVAMNLGLLGYLYYTGVVATEQRQRELELLYRNRTEVGQLLAACVPAQQSELTRQQFEAQRRELDDLKQTLQNRRQQLDALRYSLENRIPMQSDLSREQISRQNGEIESLKKEIDELKQKMDHPP